MVSTRFRDYNVDSNEAISIIFVHSKKDILNPHLKFKPLMTHQIFDDENIYGYHNLQIDIYFTAHSGYCFVDISYDDSLRDSGKFSLEPDNIMEHLKPWFPNNLMTDLNKFKERVEVDEPDYIFGECVDCFGNKNEKGGVTGFRIINCDVTVPGFKEFHKRFQSLIIMFIDAANFIELDDPCWRILYLYEDCRMNSKRKYCPVGFCTIYLFQSTTTTARISQFFIVPFLQKLGLGYKLLEATYNYLKQTITNLEEITVESPNKIFTRMRDNLDVSYLFKEREFSREKLLAGFSDRMLFIARLKYKLSNEQARKVYEILRCYWIQDDENEYARFKVDAIKNRESQQMLKIIQFKKSKCNTQDGFVNNAVSEITPEYYTVVQKEFEKFVAAIQPTVKYLRKTFGNPHKVRRLLIAK